MTVGKISFLALLALLAGCNSATSTIPTTLDNAPAARFARAGVGPLPPNCCARRKALFVTDAFGGSQSTGTVYAFDYDSGALLGQLSPPPEGWSEVQGACVDKHGDVYFANTAMSTVDEYSHGGTFIAAIADSGQYPVGCAYDATTGNFAVDNIINVSGGPGSISIYQGTTLLHTYYPPNMFRVVGGGYRDDTGTLWLGGANSSGAATFDTFANGTFTPFTVGGLRGGSIGSDFQWSAKTHTMNASGSDASGNSVIWHVSSAKKIVGKTILTYGAAAFFIKGPQVATIDAVNLVAYLFDYPAGGNPIRTYNANFVSPIGIVVSANVP